MKQETTNTAPAAPGKQNKIAPEFFAIMGVAYDYFNKKLFNDLLPACMITLERKKGANGYFKPKCLQGRHGSSAIIDIIALNPDGFVDEDDMKVLSTLAHEMVHLWQHTFGEPSRKGYHNGEWRDKMFEVGLTPSSTGKKGGNCTGQKMSHYIDEDGPFERAYNDLKTQGVIIPWESVLIAKTPKEPKKNKARYYCPNGHANLWSQPGQGSFVICKTCKADYIEETND